MDENKESIFVVSTTAVITCGPMMVLPCSGLEQVSRSAHDDDSAHIDCGVDDPFESAPVHPDPHDESGSVSLLTISFSHVFRKTKLKELRHGP